jgi:hypothetical protein
MKKKENRFACLFVARSKVKGQKNIKTKSEQNLDESCSKVNKTTMSHDQRSKEH